MRTRTYWGVVLGILVLIVLVPYIPGLRSVALFLTTPATPLTETTQRSRNIFESIRAIAALRSRVAELETENVELKSQLAIQTEQLQAAALAAAETATMGDRHGMTARVIATSPTQALSSIVLNVGERDHVRPGEAVLSHGFFIGIVEQVSVSTSRVNLISNPRFPIPVRLSDSRAQGLLKSGLTGFVVTDIPANVTLVADESVLTSGLGGVVPDGLPVGKIGSIISAQSEILQRADFESPVQFGTLEFVIVLGDV